ncbi:MAG: class I SAM-dependent methyltransferase [Peptococcaceae bacterium]|jgi:ubiquinone/menaquinone biosynthesis C-methylase UbiE|nr:MAG: class I SAM-dependent methyltransferase [Peptococcaceae bacterium]
MITVNPKFLDVRPGDAILDVGCGEGRHAWTLTEYPGCQVFAMDMDREVLLKNLFMLKTMDNRGETNSPYLVLQADALHLPFPDATFDRIICSEVLEHVDDEIQATAELARVLKPGGTLGLSVPTWLTEVVYWKLDKNYSHPGGHIRIFTEKQLKKLLQKFNLRVYNCDRRHAFHSPYWFLRCLFRLHRENSLIPSLYFRWLNWVESAPRPFLKYLERRLDPFLGKSLVLYAQKASGQVTAAGVAPAAPKHQQKKAL